MTGQGGAYLVHDTHRSQGLGWAFGEQSVRTPLAEERINPTDRRPAVSLLGSGIPAPGLPKGRVELALGPTVSSQDKHSLIPVPPTSAALSSITSFPSLGSSTANR